MPQTCPRCQRANPAEAAFCHFDGCLLRQGAAAASGAFFQEFVFPSGRRCRSFEELAQGIYDEWEDARELLGDGTFAGFLAGLGRADLARAAREAQTAADRDIALTNFIAALPATQAQGPKLGLSPRRLVVGPARVGEQRPALLRINNDGRGALQGKLTVAEGSPWLRVGGGSDPQTLAIHTPRELPVALTIDTTGLVVGQNYSAKLVIVTNGGVAEVPIRLDLAARPFARVPYQGASTPHELARKMRDQPHPAVPMLESGEIARWFESNGWTYPISGAPAPGLAAVQQFFEELGLARAPQIAISQQEFRLSCRPPDVRHEQVTIRSPARKLVYGRAESDSAWLKVTTPSISGQAQAAIDFTVDSSLMDEDRQWEGTLKVVANAGQTFLVRVIVDVQGNKKGWFRAKPSTATHPVAPAAAPPTLPTAPAAPAVSLPTWAPPTAPPPPRPTTATQSAASGPASLGQLILVGAILGLLVRLALVLPADLYARLLSSATRSPTPGTLAAWLLAPAADEGFLKLLALATWWVGALVGAALVWRGGGRWSDLLCGLLAGAVAGVAGAITLGSALVVGDTVPRGLLRTLLGERALATALATLLWVVTALLCWMILGAAGGLTLGLFGRTGRRVMAAAAAPLAGLLRLCGFTALAEGIDLHTQ